MKFSTVLWAAAAVALVVPEKRELAPVYRVANNPLADSYIVTLKDGHTPEEIAEHRQWIEDKHQKGKRSEDNSIHFFDVPKFHGYHGNFTRDLLEEIQKNPMVDFVEEDQQTQLQSLTHQQDAPWGILRISQRDYKENVYTYDDQGGEGVTAFVVDGKANVSHPEFEGRAFYAGHFNTDGTSVLDAPHASHVMGTLGAKTYGVAKKARLGNVQVTNNSGGVFLSSMLKGLEYVYNYHQENHKNKGYKATTVNMSIGGFKTKSFDKILDQFNEAGIVLSTAAGNGYTDTCDHMPLGSPYVLNTGAIDKKLHKSLYSNHGSCISVFAPGDDIESVKFNDENKPAILGGTSMASPHVAGAVTYFLSLRPESSSEYDAGILTAAEVRKRIIDFSTKDMVLGLPDGTPNRIVFQGGDKWMDFWK